MRGLYQLPKHVPEWSYFNRVVIDNCLKMKRNRQRLTFSLFNLWITEFREMATSDRGFAALTGSRLPQKVDQFRPIILIRPPCVGAT